MLFCLICLFSFMLPAVHISGPVYIIEDIYWGGTTVGLTSFMKSQEAMNHYHVFSDDSTINDLNSLLGSMKKVRHSQRKEVGVRIALSYNNNTGEKHYLILYGDKEYSYYCMVDYNFKTNVYIEYKCRSQEEKEKLETIITVLEVV